MNSVSLPNYFTAEGVNQTALKDYKTYLQHYALKNLQPMAFEEFLRNYRTSA